MMLIPGDLSCSSDPQARMDLRASMIARRPGPFRTSSTSPPINSPIGGVERPPARVIAFPFRPGSRTGRLDRQASLAREAGMRAPRKRMNEERR